MTTRLAALALCLLAAATPAAACSIAPPDVSAFRPALEEAHLPFVGVDGLPPPLPAPTLEPADVWRYEGPPRGCGSGLGMLTVRLAWPADARAGLDAVGFYFRVVEGEAPADLFPAIPVVGRHGDGQASFDFMWLEGAWGMRQLDFVVEVFAVDAALRIGPATRLVVRDARGAP